LHPCTSFAEDFLLVHKGEDNGGPFFKETKNTVVDTTHPAVPNPLGRKKNIPERKEEQTKTSISYLEIYFLIY